MNRGGSMHRDVERILWQLDPPARVKIVALPRLPEGGDIVEFIESRKAVVNVH